MLRRILVLEQSECVVGTFEIAYSRPDFFSFNSLLPFVSSFLFCMSKLGQAFVLGKFPFRIPSGAQTLAADVSRGFTKIIDK
jgi:hypothetical protein